MATYRDFIDGLKPYGDKRIVATFGLGMASGFPLTFVISLLGIWLSREGVSKSDVGLFALITTFYTWKFLWSPAIDRLPLGPITKVFWPAPGVAVCHSGDDGRFAHCHGDVRARDRAL